MEKQKFRFLQLPAGRTPLASSNVQSLVIVSHPQEPYQFVVGLSDGGAHVFEPLKSEGKWGVPPFIENGSTNNVVATLVGASSDEAQR
ncbi:hypothetical protein VNO77_27210 [Canavalia gladiata]|uniref:Uncharacterized protein n=1 Tax=Canavalia gladiata TaxID=3824 RepID=A0AAN9Q3Z8_CANGL